MGGIGTGKTCPVVTTDRDNPCHCYEICEWFDGEGCAVWRIVNALERGNYWLELLAKNRGDSK